MADISRQFRFMQGQGRPSQGSLFFVLLLTFDTVLPIFLPNTVRTLVPPLHSLFSPYFIFDDDRLLAFLPDYVA